MYSNKLVDAEKGTATSYEIEMNRTVRMAFVSKWHYQIFTLREGSSSGFCSALSNNSYCLSYLVNICCSAYLLAMLIRSLSCSCQCIYPSL